MSRGLAIVIRLPVGRATLSPFLGFSLAVHVLVVVALVVTPMFRKRSVPPRDLLVVNLAGDLPGPPAAKAAPPAPSPPAPVTPPPKEKKMEAKPAEPVLTKKKKKKEVEKPKPAAEPTATPAPTTPSPTTAPPTTGPETPGGGGGGITSMDELGDAEFAWYRASVIAALQARWVRPVLEGSAQPLSATVAFVVARDGTVTNLRLDTSSGVPSLDRSALRAVQEASPLPPLPSTWHEPTLEARFRFELTPGSY